MKYPVSFITLLAIIFLVSCQKIDTSDNQTRSEFNGEEISFGVIMPTVDVPRPDKKTPLKHQPEALPKNSKGRYPIYDGNSFHVTFPIKEQNDLNTAEVFDAYVLPALKAMGFNRDNIHVSFSRLPEQGIKNQRADINGLMDQVNDEYRRNPKLLRPKTQQMLDVLSGQTTGNVAETVSKALEMGEGMNLKQYLAAVERLETVYPFQQVEGEVPIEHTVVNASRWEGQSIHSVYGSFFNSYDIENQVEFDKEEIIAKIPDSILKIESISEKLTDNDVDRFRRVSIKDGPHLVLLPYGTNNSGNTRMHYAYRMIVRTYFMNQRDFEFLLWADAENSQILKLQSLTQQSTAARGEVFNRGPDVGTTIQSFRVDDASGGSYQLSLSGVMNRVDYLANGFDADDVSIDDSTNGSSATLANFNQIPINDETEALCLSGSNKAYQQVNFFANIHKYRSWTMSNGIFTPFPSSAWSPRVESASAGCNAFSSMNFGVCGGYTDSACPDFTGGSNNFSNRAINTALDNTWIAHEIGHSITPRYTNTRPADWCGPGTCAVPQGWNSFHDIADFWADHFESTNCWSGWFAKNLDGLDASLYCGGTHSEGGGVPRLHEVDIPFDPSDPKDHFPEHRDLASGVYSDMQIPTAALWQVRLGMRSKCRPSGTPQFAVRFARALKRTGFFTDTESNDRRVYEYLFDLESMMTDEWATAGSPGGALAFRHNGSHTTSKVTSGFAATGLFLVPSACIDNDLATADPGYCPGGEFGGDAVVDIDDNDSADDLNANGVTQKEVDFLELGGSAPSFNVWTGPRYRFDSSGEETLTSPAPCNAQYQVEVSTTDTFDIASTQLSGWLNVDTDPTTASPECFASWTPDATQWTDLQAGGDGSRLYYRVRTRDISGLNERMSTEPGNGLWTVPPAYAVITADGQSDY